MWNLKNKIFILFQEQFFGHVTFWWRHKFFSEKKEPSLNSIAFLNHVLHQFEVEWSIIYILLWEIAIQNQILVLLLL